MEVWTSCHSHPPYLPLGSRLPSLPWGSSQTPSSIHTWDLKVYFCLIVETSWRIFYRSRTSKLFKWMTSRKCVYIILYMYVCVCAYRLGHCAPCTIAPANTWRRSHKSQIFQSLYSKSPLGFNFSSSERGLGLLSKKESDFPTLCLDLNRWESAS